MSRGNAVGIVARLSRQEKTHTPALYRISIVLLESVLTVGMIAHAQLRGEIATAQHHTILTLRLYASRAVHTMIGAQHQRLADVVFLARNNIEIVSIGLRISQHGIDRTAFGLGNACPHLVQFIPVAEEIVII